MNPEIFIHIEGIVRERGMKVEISMVSIGLGIALFLIGYSLRSPSTTVFQETISAAPAPAPAAPVVVQVSGGGGGDDRYTMAPRPQRSLDLGPQLVSIATRGSPDPYQQMGVITGSDGKVLPLYGRRTAPRSDRFQYYTRTDTYNPVALPVTFKKRDCQDQVGCEEVFDGDSIRMQGTGDEGKVKLYGFSSL